MANNGTTMPATRVYRTVNPATGELVREFPPLSDEEAESLLARAHDAYGQWRTVPLGERCRLVLRFAELVESHADELGRLVTVEMGKTFAQTKSEAGKAAAMLRYYAENAESLLADEETEVPGFSRAITRREPVGVILGIEPWNAPLTQAMRATAPNLVLGNTVLLKPSELCAASTLRLGELADAAGLPAGAYQTALIAPEQASRYLSDDRVRGVTLTGSDRAGSAIGEQAGRHIKPVVLELGGSDAFIVLNSADVEKAVSTAVSCRLALGGQACVSPKRIILTEAVAEEFLTRFSESFAGQQVGDPFDANTAIGPLSSEAAADLLQEQYADAVGKGATVLVPGGRVGGPGAFFKPAAITGITTEMRVYEEEAFGPLAMIYRVPDADSAVRLANDTPYGLGGTVFSEDLDEARRVAGLLDTGGVGINKWLAAPTEVPFGGTKRSGIGRELGRSGMDQFANTKTYGIG
ncbi:succinate-semialdehyde dehydrogenase [Amycolatopsis sp. A1MSW2902]|uniref:aldehyde dehydrogenase family protein n=1 Tax=Amycolatopsis sp. A1MSW2902 TaxID=687413 RepID=UPI00307F4D27